VLARRLESHAAQLPYQYLAEGADRLGLGYGYDAWIMPLVSNSSI
jgi:hypothetical protein